MNFVKRKNSKGDKTVFYYDMGRLQGQRESTGIFIYNNPKNAVEKKHNQEALAILKVKQGEAIIEQQAIGTAYISKHKFKNRFL